MIIAWENFTPWASLAGGVIIGLSAAIFILFNGRIAGISGIVGGLLRPREGDLSWRLFFVLGIVLSSLFWRIFAELPAISVDANLTIIIVAGLLVGLGTRFGAGCTSGHGVCGLSRLSVRSVAATIMFMGAGFLTVFIMRHVLAA